MTLFTNIGHLRQQDMQITQPSPALHPIRPKAHYRPLSGLWGKSWGPDCMAKTDSGDTCGFTAATVRWSYEASLSMLRHFRKHGRNFENGQWFGNYGHFQQGLKWPDFCINLFYVSFNPRAKKMPSKGNFVVLCNDLTLRKQKVLAGQNYFYFKQDLDVFCPSLHQNKICSSQNDCSSVLDLVVVRQCHDSLRLVNLALKHQEKQSRTEPLEIPGTGRAGSAPGEPMAIDNY